MVERFRGRVSEGMQVRGADGEKLGRVVACQPAGFVVEKGFLFPKDLVVPYERVTAVNNGEVLISLGRADLTESGAARAAATGAAGAATTSETTRSGVAGIVDDVKGAARNLKESVTRDKESVTRDRDAERAELEPFGKTTELCVPLIEEEIITSKHVEKVGEVHVRKEIITEEKQITVPVMREVIRVERVPVSHEVRAGDRPFEKESYDIAIREEQITVEKRPVVREELHVGKEIQRGEETASATVRRERADVETVMTSTSRRVDAVVTEGSALHAAGPNGPGR